MTRIRNFFTRVVWHIGPLVAAILVLLAVKTVDQSIPVIVDFKIVHQEITPEGSVVIDGVMNKQRDCTFEAMSAYADGNEPVNVRFLNRPEGVVDVARAVRVQLWGPWEILADNDTQTIEIYAQHRCHIFWPTSTQLIKFTVVKVTENGSQSRVESNSP